jgi:ABC-2 type transport system ATP-binding protein
MSSTVIEFQDLEKTYRTPWSGKTVKAVSGVSMAVQEGEAFGFIGPNGAGKSTTIKILMGSLRPTAGKSLLNGVDSTLPQSRAGVGYVPESPYLYDYLTPLEILELGCRFHRVAAPDTRRYCMEWLDRFSLAGAATRRIRTFSKGMAQRTALAYALAVRPKLLVLDEPLSGLDPIGRKEVIDILMNYRSQGGSIFFSSHVLYDVERLADRFGLIYQGRLTTVRSPAELVGDSVKLMVRSIGQTEVTGMSKETADRWSGEVDREALWGLLDALRQAGHTIIEIKPAMSLEQAFMKYVAEDGAVELATN